jgi:hypothetical protein
MFNFAWTWKIQWKGGNVVVPLKQIPQFMKLKMPKGQPMVELFKVIP